MKYFTWKYQTVLHFLSSCSYFFTFLLSTQFYWHIRLRSAAYFFGSPCTVTFLVRCRWLSRRCVCRITPGISSSTPPPGSIFAPSCALSCDAHARVLSRASAAKPEPEMEIRRPPACWKCARPTRPGIRESFNLLLDRSNGRAKRLVNVLTKLQGWSKK